MLAISGWMSLLGAAACDDGRGDDRDGATSLDARPDSGSDRAPDQPIDAAADGSPLVDAPAADSPAADSVADLPALADGREAGPAPPIQAKLDLLFVVDNSNSMAEEQGNLVNNFASFMQALGVTDGADGPDLHIAVVSSDLGAGAGTFSATSCPMGGDQGLFCRTQGSAAAADVCARCQVDTSQGRFLRTRSPNFTGSLGNAFSCMARLGTTGCGFEHTLGALTSALGAAQNGPFLRADAYLAFVIITDEDDCTAPADSALFASAIPDQEGSLRCALEGHACNGAHNTGAVDVDVPLAQCQTAGDGALRPVGALVNQVLAVKPDPTRIVAAGIFGWPLPGQEASARYRIGLVGTSRGQLPICQSGNGSAAVGLRVKRFVESFPNHTALSICQSDFRPALEQIAARIRTATGN